MKTKQHPRILSLTFLISFLFFLLFILPLILSTVWMSHTVQEATDESTVSLGEFYLDEITERNVDEISSALQQRMDQMQRVIAEMHTRELPDINALRAFLTSVQRINGLEICALVDENGTVYTSQSTFSGIARFGFLSDQITEPVIYTTSSYGTRAMVMLALPMEQFTVGDTRMVSYFTGVDVNDVIASFRLQQDENQVYCRVFLSDGTCLVSPDGAYDQSYNLFDYLLHNADFTAPYSLDTLIADWSAHQAGYISYVSPAGRTYMSYKPVPNTDWIMDVRLRYSTIDAQVSSTGARIYSSAQLQLAIVITTALVAFWLAYSLLQRSRQAQFEEQKQRELLLQEQAAARQLQKALDRAEQAREENRRLAENQDRSHRLIHETLQSGMWQMHFNAVGAIEKVEWSPEFRKILGFASAEEFPDQLSSWADRIHSEEKEAVLKDLHDTIDDYTGQRTHDIDYRMQTRDGVWRWFHSAGRLSRKPDGTPISFTGLFVDITERKYHEDREQALEKASLQDRLTGLPNRRAYELAVERICSQPLHEDLAVIAMDVNGLKTVNDNIGHAAGDELICGAAECISTCFKPYGTCYRTGGDEFIVLIEHPIPDTDACFAAFREAQAAWHGSMVSTLAISAGIAAVQEDPSAQFRRLTQLADSRMYEDKRAYYLTHPRGR